MCSRICAFVGVPFALEVPTFERGIFNRVKQASVRQRVGHRRYCWCKNTRFKNICPKSVKSSLHWRNQPGIVTHHVLCPCFPWAQGPASGASDSALFGNSPPPPPPPLLRCSLCPLQHDTRRCPFEWSPLCVGFLVLIPWRSEEAALLKGLRLEGRGAFGAEELSHFTIRFGPVSSINDCTTFLSVLIARPRLRVSGVISLDWASDSNPAPSAYRHFIAR